MMLQHSVADNCAISTGTMHSIRDFLRVVFGHAGIANWDRYIEINMALYRPGDMDDLYGQLSKAMTVLGWGPTVGFGELAGMVLDSDLKRFPEDSVHRTANGTDAR